MYAHIRSLPLCLYSFCAYHPSVLAQADRRGHGKYRTCMRKGNRECDAAEGLGITFKGHKSSNASLFTDTCNKRPSAHLIRSDVNVIRKNGH